MSLAVVVVAVTGVGAVKWFYPYAIDDLESEIKSIDKVIEENTALECDFLGDCEWDFRERLDAENRRTLEIKNMSIVEPDRLNVPAWLAFRWREMRNVKARFLALKELKRDVMVEIDKQKRHLVAPTSTETELA
ncbi:hypothetical protein V5O48_012330 [Marasmius crinis-equi]|uniref:Uncharacterized protein n=1 Tax=Marasmius crinis-equi TaxID=585013 RepID=A0ABR3F3J3_9AGAR